MRRILYRPPLEKWSPDVVPVFSAEESLKQFKVAPGFKVELVASEPMVKDPVFVDWDDDGSCGWANFEHT